MYADGDPQRIVKEKHETSSLLLRYNAPIYRRSAARIRLSVVVFSLSLGLLVRDDTVYTHWSVLSLLPGHKLNRGINVFLRLRFLLPFSSSSPFGGRRSLCAVFNVHRNLYLHGSRNSLESFDRCLHLRTATYTHSTTNNHTNAQTKPFGQPKLFIFRIRIPPLHRLAKHKQ